MSRNAEWGVGLALLLFAAPVGASTTTHNGATLLALIMIAAGAAILVHAARRPDRVGPDANRPKTIVYGNVPVEHARLEFRPRDGDVYVQRSASQGLVVGVWNRRDGRWTRGTLS